MMNAEAATSENTAAVAEQGATVSPEKASWKKGASPKKGAPKGQKQRPSIPRFRHHHSGVIERADPAKKLRTVLVWGTSTAFLSRFQLNDVMNFIPPFARRLEPGQNHPDHTIFDFDKAAIPPPTPRMIFMRTYSTGAVPSGIATASGALPVSLYFTSPRRTSSMAMMVDFLENVCSIGRAPPCNCRARLPATMMNR